MTHKYATLMLGSGETRDMSHFALEGPITPLLKSAGYIAHCPCGCSPATRPPATSAEDEPLLAYMNPEYVEIDGVEMLYFDPKRCLPIAMRLEELRAKAVLIYEECDGVLSDLIRAFTYHGTHNQPIIFR